MSDRPCGILVLDKPTGLSSRAALDVLARPLKRLGVKAGHAGTLDPLASGVLVVCVGTATRLIESVQRMTKVYRATIRLGATSDTLDADGSIVGLEVRKIPDEGRVRAALADQVGEIDQAPPAFSALKVGGERAYDLARAGRTVELSTRRVRIDRIDLLSYAWPRVEVEVACGAGTYIRSIARDLGERLDCGGLIQALARTRIGPFELAHAVPAEPGLWPIEAIAARLRSPLEALIDVPRQGLSPRELAEVRQGRSIMASAMPEDGDEVALIGPEGRLAALGLVDRATGRIAPRKVFDPGG